MLEAKSRLIALLEYIEQVEKLKRRAAFVVPDEFFVAYQADLKGLPGVQFNLQAEGDDLWLRVPRLLEQAPPAPIGELEPWLTLSKTPDKAPELKSERSVAEKNKPALTLLLTNFPSIGAHFERYVAEQWAPWSEAEKPRRKTISLYNRLFSLQQAMAVEGSETPLEMVWGIGQAVWKKPGAATAVRHPVITQGCEVVLNEKNFDLVLRPRDVDPALEIDCYADMEISGVTQLDAFWKASQAAAANRVNPFEASTFDSVLKAAVGYLDSSGEYRVGGEEPVVPPPGETLCVTDTWVLFARRRSEHIFLQDIERLKKKVAEAVSLPNVLRGFVEIGDSEVKTKIAVTFRGLSTAFAGANAKELFFPLPYNDEQVAIVQKLETSDGVVVQGPPGTGKSHTIANIICHFLAQGKRVLVTAKGESALGVLQEKLPEEIRPLSVALLTNEREGMKQFEHAIQEIATRESALDPTRTEREIVALEEQLNALHARMAGLDTDIAQYASRHLQHYTFRGEQKTPEALARHVVEHAEAFEWFVDPVSDSNELLFTDGDIGALRQARVTVGERIAYGGMRVPAPDNFPTWPTLVALHKDLVRAREIESGVDSGQLLNLVDSTPETYEKAKCFKARLEQRKAVRTRIEQGNHSWTESLAQRIASAEVGDPAMTALRNICKIIDALEKTRRDLLAKAVEMPAGAELHEDFLAAMERLVAGKSAFALPFGKKEARDMIAAVTVAGVRPAQLGDWESVQAQASFQLEARKACATWNSVAGEFGLPPTTDISALGFRALTGHRAHIKDLETLIFSFDSDMAQQVGEVMGQQVAKEFEISGEPHLERIEYSILQHLDKGQLRYAMQQVQALLDKLDGQECPVALDLRQFLTKALGGGNEEEPALHDRWQALVQELKTVVSLHPVLEIIDRVADLVERSGAPLWAKRMRTESAQDAGDAVTPSNWTEAWDWRRARTFIEGIDGHDKLKKLFDGRRTVEKDLSRTYQHLIAEKTWLGVYRNSPDEIRQALQAYLNSIQAMGSGTGIRAVRHRKNAREAMIRAYRAVPCWVLPEWRVSETIPPEVGLFDLVVIDEASQSDIWALPALLRGKKLLVVGDHKQVSPSAVGTAEVKITELVGRFLKDQPHGSEMTPDKSVYDLARVVFAGNSVMLKEHFRCVPAIIEFSNREFYQGEIKPLRIPTAAERLDPPLIDVFVKGGFRQKDINPVEARAVVDEIKAILADPTLAGRSIGVITLLGQAQAAHVHKLVHEEISATDIVGRHIAVGPPPVFQGRERDILMVSLVIANGDGGAPNRQEMEQRFNVAISRARDRMYLFRSVEEKDYKPESLTARLIRHFRHPFVSDAKQVSALRDLCESDFEREMFDLLVRRDYRVRPQVKVGAYRIDMVIEGAEGRRLAIECDGDRFHGPGQWSDDMSRQRTLERAGWTFWRCFASSFVTRRREVEADLLTTLGRMSIAPLGSESVDNTMWVQRREVDPYAVVGQQLTQMHGN